MPLKWRSQRIYKILTRGYLSLSYIRSSPIPKKSRINRWTSHTSFSNSYIDRLWKEIFFKRSWNRSKYSKCRIFKCAENVSTSCRLYNSYARTGLHEQWGAAGVDSAHNVWCKRCAFRTQRWQVLNSKFLVLRICSRLPWIFIAFSLTRTSGARSFNVICLILWNISFEESSINYVKIGPFLAKKGTDKSSSSLSTKYSFATERRIKRERSVIQKQ